MKKQCLLIIALIAVCIQLEAYPFSTLQKSTPASRNLEFRVGILAGMSANLGGIEQVDGQGVGSAVFNNADYFKGTGRYHIIPSPQVGLELDIRLNGKNDFLFGFTADQRILRFDYIQKEAPTDLEYRSDFRYLQLSLGYARNIGKEGYYLGLEWQKNFLLYNNSYIRFDGEEYLSVLDNALDSESICLYFGQRYKLRRRDELDARLGFYCDTTQMYPTNSDSPIVMLIFMGLSLNVSWSMPIT
ncbi:MAG TPA: hypothetical protein VN445_15235 [Rectinemataceae bacterium]|nr:hypothetical protein [Rectinemataceae bacterium]